MTGRTEDGGQGEGGRDRRHLLDYGKGEREIKDEEEDTCQTVRRMKHRNLNLGRLVEGTIAHF